MLMKKLVEVEMDGQAAAKQVAALRDSMHRLRQVRLVLSAALIRHYFVQLCIIVCSSVMHFIEPCIRCPLILIIFVVFQAFLNTFVLLSVSQICLSCGVQSF